MYNNRTFLQNYKKVSLNIYFQTQSKAQYIENFFTLKKKKTLIFVVSKLLFSCWWRCGDSHSGPSTVPQRSLQFIKSLIFTAYQLLRTLHRYFVMFSSITTNIIMAYLLFMTSYLNVRRCTFKTRAS